MTNQQMAAWPAKEPNDFGDEAWSEFMGEDWSPDRKDSFGMMPVLRVHLS